MTATTWLSAPYNGSDADFRAWGLAFQTAMLAIGLTQTSDTGQVNWASVSRAPTISTVAGYEIYRFNDAAQSTKPVFMKIEYGAGSTNINNPQLKFTFGTGSNGAGTITGAWSTSQQIGTNQSSTTAFGSYACYDATTGIFWVAPWHGSATQNAYVGFMMVARCWSEDESTQETDYLSWIYLTNQSFSGCSVYRYSTGKLTDVSIPSAAPGHSATWGSGSTKYFARHYMPGGDRVLCVPGLLTVGGNDFSAATTGAVTAVATAHTFIALTNLSFWGMAYQGASNQNVKALCLWE